MDGNGDAITVVVAVVVAGLATDIFVYIGPRVVDSS